MNKKERKEGNERAHIIAWDPREGDSQRQRQSRVNGGESQLFQDFTFIHSNSSAGEW